MTTIKRKPLNLSAPVTFMGSDSPSGPGRFSIKAYTGAIINTYFGKLVFEVSGMTSKKLSLIHI